MSCLTAHPLECYFSHGAEAGEGSLGKRKDQKEATRSEKILYTWDVGGDFLCLQTLEFKSIDTEQSKKILYFSYFSVNCQQFSF